MTRLIERLRPRVADLLRDLAARPLSLFCLLVAANAVALPYGNFIHDANLYGVQVLNRVDPGHFAGDLYFQYGSQDKFSVFSLAAAPIVKWLGLPVGFFLLYLLSNSLFLFALQRFVRALVSDPIVSTLALLFVAVTEIPFGGLRIFHVNEWFLTPRIAANALVLLGLERLLAGRMGQAWLFVLLALPLHPLMAFPGVLILAGWLAMTHLRSRNLLALLSLTALAAMALLLDRPLASRLFGQMDDVWRDSIHRVNPYHFPLSWRMEDWLRVVMSLIVGLLAAWDLRERTPIRRLLVLMSAVAILGVAGGILACFLPYALPLQGQPWRWLWPLELALYPLGFSIAQRLWAMRHGVTCLAALGLLAYLDGSPWDNSLFLLLVSSTALFGVAIWRGMASSPRVLDWPVRAAAFALILTPLLWTALNLGLVVKLRRQLACLLEPVEMLQVMTSLVDPLCRLALMLSAAVFLARLAGIAWRFSLSCLCVCLASLLLFFVLPQTRFYSEKHGLHEADERFVAAFLAEHAASDSSPIVYWPIGKIQHLWLNLRVPSFFHIHQVVGNLFSSGNASAGRRRAQIVKKFELELWREENLLISPEQTSRILAIYQARGNEPPPQLSDLVKLCQEEQLDFAVLPQKFDGLYAATNGKIFIYDCRMLRASLNRTPLRETTSLPQHLPSSNN